MFNFFEYLFDILRRGVYNDFRFNEIEPKTNKKKGALKVSYDYSKLNGRIAEKCGTQAAFAEKMGLSERTISLKLNNKIAWKQPEMQKAATILEFSDMDIQTYFFTMKVQ